MVSNIIGVISAVVGTVGFCLVLRVRRHRLPIIAVSTAICYSVFLLVFHFSANDFISNAIAALVGALLSEILARLIKAPVTVFLIPTILPLVPGARLYYTIEAFFQGSYRDALNNFAATGRAIGAILLGIITISTITKCMRNIETKKHSS